MIRLFLTNLFFTNLFLIPYLVLLRIDSFLDADKYQLIEGDFILNYFDKVPSLVLSIIAVFIILLQALVINSIVNNNKLTGNNNQLSGLLFALGSCLIPGFLSLHPILIANTFVIIAFAHICKLFKSYKPIVHTFMAGFYIGLSCIFAPHYILLGFFIIQCMVILRDISIREFLQGLSGLFCPIILLYAFSTIGGKPINIFNYLSIGLPNFENQLSVYTIIALVFIAIAIIWIVLNQANVRKKKSVKAQKLITLLFLILAYSVPMLIFNSAKILNHFSLLIFPMSILYSMNFFVWKRLVIAEILHILIIIGIFILQFQLL